MASHSKDCSLLLEKIAKKDKQAFSELYQLQVGKVRGFLAKKGVQTEQILDDLCQDIFLKIWHKASAFDASKGSANTWIVVLAQNLLNDYWRKMLRTPVADALELDSEFELPYGADLDSKGDQFATRLSLDKALACLTKDQQSLFSMVYIKGFTLKECSESLKIPNGTIKWRINQIQKILRSEVNK